MDRPEIGPDQLAGMKVLKTRSPEARDRAELVNVSPENLAQKLSSSENLRLTEFFQSLEQGLSQAQTVVVRGPPRSGKTRWVRAYLRARTKGYRDDGFGVFWPKPGDRLEDCLGTSDPDRGRYRSTPILDLWLRALRHKAKPHFLVFEGLAAPSAEALCRQLRDVQENPESLWLHDEALRCQAKLGPSEEVVKFFVCQQDCRQCFFVQPGYPQGVTEAVKDFVPARIIWPENLKLILLQRREDPRLVALEGLPEVNLDAPGE